MGTLQNKYYFNFDLISFLCCCYIFVEYLIFQYLGHVAYTARDCFYTRGNLFIYCLVLIFVGEFGVFRVIKNGDRVVNITLDCNSYWINTH